MASSNSLTPSLNVNNDANRSVLHSIHPASFPARRFRRSAICRSPLKSLYETELTRGEQVEWDAAKEKALWKILSKASKNSDIDCTFHYRLISLPVDKLIYILQGMNKLSNSTYRSPSSYNKQHGYMRGSWYKFGRR